MFVGVSRAVRWACLSTLEAKMIPPVAEIVNQQVLDYVEVQRVTGGAPSGSVAEDEDELPY